MSVPVIAIDGPSASVKGTVASRVAEALGYHYLESGALYRLVALAGGEPARTARDLDVVFRNGRIFLSKQDVTEALRTESVGVQASHIASIPAVRAALLERQRAFRQAPGLVADGRDMGTVVFPDARVKFFLHAAAEVRASRRAEQLRRAGVDADEQKILHDMEQRDARDSSRADGPLRPPPDAEIIDTTDMSFEQVVGTLEDHSRARVEAAGLTDALRPRRHG